MADAGFCKAASGQKKLMSGRGGGGGSTLLSDLNIFASVFQTQTMGIIGYRGRGPAPT